MSQETRSRTLTKPAAPRSGLFLLQQKENQYEKQTQNKAVLVAAAGGWNCAHKSGRGAARICGGCPRHTGDSFSGHTGNR